MAFGPALAAEEARKSPGAWVRPPGLTDTQACLRWCAWSHEMCIYLAEVLVPNPKASAHMRNKCDTIIHNDIRKCGEDPTTGWWPG